MDIILLEFSYYAFIISLISSGLFFVVLYILEINSQKRTSIKNLWPEEKFLLKEILSNGGFSSSYAENNEFLKVLEEEGIIHKKISLNKNRIEYDIKYGVKRHVKKEFELIS